MWRTDPLLGNDSVNTFARKRATIGRPLPGNGSVNKTTLLNNRQAVFYVVRARTKKVVWVICCQKLREFGWRRVHLNEVLARNGSSSGDGSLRWLSRSGEKGIRLWQEDFMYDLKWQRDCNKSVARIGLVKTENPPIVPQSPSSGGWYNRPVVVAVPSGLCLNPLIMIKKM
jgi:hypothetical protein